MDCFLIICKEDGSEGEQKFRVEEGETVVGRSESAGISVPDPRVSRKHLRLVRTRDEVVVESLSRFGTALDERNLEEPTILKPGQKLTLSRDTTLLFQTEEQVSEEGDAATATQAERENAEGQGEDGTFDIEGIGEPDREPEKCRPELSEQPEEPSGGTSAMAGEFARAVRRRQSKPRRRIALPASLGAAVVVVVLLIGLALFVPNKTWLDAFFFQRGPVQWVSLYVFSFGLVLLVKRAIRLRGESRALRLLQDGKLEKGRLRTVSLRFRRLHARLKQGKDTGIWTYARDLARRDNEELDSAYGAVTAVIQVLPLIGFFGTVLGLSKGLYTSFVASGAETSTAVFGRAIGTAFDTTLLALACTIMIIIGQRLLRQHDENLLTRLNAFVDDYVEDALPAQSEVESVSFPEATLQSLQEELQTLYHRVADETIENFGLAGDRFVAAVNAKVEVMKEDFSKASDSGLEALHKELAKVSEHTCRAVADEMKEQSRTLAVALRSIQECLEASKNDEPGTAPTGQAGATSMDTLLEELRELRTCSQKNSAFLAETIRTVLEPINDSLGRIAQLDERLPETLDPTIRKNVTELGNQLRRFLSQPRRISVVETPTYQNVPDANADNSDLPQDGRTEPTGLASSEEAGV